MTENVENINELELECGVTLHLQPVKQFIVLEFIGPQVKQGVGGPMVGLGPSVIDGNIKLLNYLAGWGVANEVPQEAREEFGMFGGGERVIRSRWVRDLMTNEEAAQFFAQVLALTFSQDGNSSG